MGSVLDKENIENRPNHTQPFLIDLLKSGKDENISVQKIRSLHAGNLPELLILELNSNINICKVIESHQGHNVIIALWISKNEVKHLPELFKMNVHGYFLKGMNTKEIQIGINSISNGIEYIHPAFVPNLFQSYKKIYKEQIKRPKKLLSKREWDVLEQIVHGKNTDSISEHLNIASKTVKNHIGSILKKLHVKDRTSAAVLAIKNKWIFL
ncbi:response regulator transcription factor [Bacillus sp. FJAT-49711]|uniref:response regulator transcription factor n=1 Tax=Bacillus sp. FJAT-49711 TaxID=2833585 RepID=UPI001BC9B28C|nr:response regulator transcription factor [Bacillus sp. FJAT-49711]MBS4219060.1 response regulator transcription factor [Bacillus sp. FJAT-49711]